MKGWGFHKSTWKDRDTCQLRPLKGLTDTSYSWRQENFLVWWFIRIQMKVHLQGFRVLKLVCERGTIWYYKVKRYLFCLKWCIKGWAVEPRGEAFSYKLFLSTPPPLPRPCLMPYDTVIVLNELLLVCAARTVLLFLFHFRPRGAILQRLHRANLE